MMLHHFTTSASAAEAVLKYKLKETVNSASSRSGKQVVAAKYSATPGALERVVTAVTYDQSRILQTLTLPEFLRKLSEWFTLNLLPTSLLVKALESLLDVRRSGVITADCSVAAQQVVALVAGSGDIEVRSVVALVKKNMKDNSSTGLLSLQLTSTFFEGTATEEWYR
jgi:hypothetical protein